MKIIALVMAVAASIAPVLANAQTDLKVYGRIDLSVDSKRDDATSNTLSMEDNSSRLGFRGSEDLGGGLKAVFGLEFGFDADTGAFTSNTNVFRNSYVGLTGDFGAFALGRLDSANPTGSPLYSQVTKSIDFVVHDAGAPAIGTKVLNARNRVSNAIGYMSPVFGGFSVRARYYQSGPSPSLPPGPGVVAEDDFKQLDLGLNFERGPFAAGIGYGKDKKRGGYAANNFKNKWQAVASYDFGFINAYGAYGRDNYEALVASRRDEVDYWLLGASAPFGGNNRLIANYMERDVQADVNGKLKKFQIGVAHSLSKRTTVYALFDNEDPNSNVGNNKIRVISAGIQHNF